MNHSSFRFVGRALPRFEGPDKVSGKCLFTADVLRPGILTGKVLRSPLAHARILNIDASKANRLAGVKAIITAQDINPRRVGKGIKDVPNLARDKVLFIGDKVAAVAAIDDDVAEEALSLIDVEYEELPAVFDPLEAMKPDAPLLHPDYASYEIAELRAKATGLRNVQSVLRASKGDIQQGFAAADIVFEHTFRTQLVHQGYIEPTACVVEVDGERRVDVWATEQSPFNIRDEVAEYLEMSKEAIVFHPVTVGGSFGGKDHLHDIPLAYYLARATGRAVRIVRNYAEELTAGSPRHPCAILLKSGVKRDGTLTAREARVIYNGGAYGSYKPTPRAHMNGGLTHGGAYRVPHTKIESFCVYTNQVPGGYMRASGELQTVFAVETHMDMIAAEIGMDPVDFRMRNAMVEGDSSYSGFEYKDVKCREVLDAARGCWRRPKPKPRRKGNLTGRGIALACRHIGYGEAGAELLLQADGRVLLVTGIVDQGCGVHTIQAQIVSEILGVPPAQVIVQVGDTNKAAFHDGIKGQGATHTLGQAVSRATHALIETLRARAAARWEADPTKVEWKNGAACLKETKTRLDLIQLAAIAPREPGRGSATYKATERPREHIFQAEVADVEVDPDTGQVRVLQMSTFHDVSVVINPLTHQGQIEGGLIQGLGMAVCEEIEIHDGQVATVHLGEYKIPCVQDIPVHKTTLITKATSGPGPFKVKPAAEHSITPAPPAVANAVFNATGVRITDLPVTAEKVLAGLKAKRR
jgi:CO/xanthine dehydrogenase Mo-binding subunit